MVSPAHDPRAAALPGAVIALDVGGTKVAGAVVDARGTLLCRTQAPTNAAAGAEALMATLIAVARRLHDGYPAAHANRVGSAGQIDHVRGTVIYADENLPGWTGIALRRVQLGEDGADVRAMPDGPHLLNRSVAHGRGFNARCCPVAARRAASTAP